MTTYSRFNSPDIGVTEDEKNAMPAKQRRLFEERQRLFAEFNRTRNKEFLEQALALLDPPDSPK